MNTRVAVFDFFGVICSEVAPYWLADHFTASEAVDIKRTVVHEADRGAISQDALFEFLAMKSAVPAQTILEEWLALAVIDRTVVDYVAALAARERVALLTNSPAGFVREILRRENLEQLFEVIVVSSEVGLAKPDPAIYDHTVTVLGVPPGSATLLDDNPANVAAARDAGMGAYLVRNPAAVPNLLGW